MVDISTYTERATVIFNPDGSVKGSEAHVLTGYSEERDVPDAPGGKTVVFVVVKQDVRPVGDGDFTAVMNHGTDLVADNVAKASAIETLVQQCAEHEASIAALTNRADAAEATVTEQASILSDLREQNGGLEAQLRAAEARADVAERTGDLPG